MKKIGLNLMQQNQDSKEALASPAVYKPTGTDWQRLEEVLLPIADKINRLFKEDGCKEISCLSSLAHDFDEAAAKLKMHIRQLITNQANVSLSD